MSQLHKTVGFSTAQPNEQSAEAESATAAFRTELAPGTVSTLEWLPQPLPGLTFDDDGDVVFRGSEMEAKVDESESVKALHEQTGQSLIEHMLFYGAERHELEQLSLSQIQTLQRAGLIG
jgi:hypothetical protein